MQYHVTCKSHAVFYAISVTKSNNIITAQHRLEFACNLDDSLHNSGLLPLLHNFWVCSVSGELGLKLHPDDLLLSRCGCTSQSKRYFDTHSITHETHGQ